MPDLSQEIITSSAKFLTWQRDAMRRLTVGKIQEQDYVELVALAKAEKSPPAAGVPVAVPLAAEHLSQAHAGGGVATLLSIHEVEGVNALEAKQKLNFGPQGITIVFGRNGAGKSGYSRILRCACRARKAPVILSNVVKAGPVIPPSAKFLVRSAAGDVEVSWQQGRASPDQLAHLAVFDRECEKDIVDERGEATFIPPGLSRFDELVRVVDEVKRRIEAEDRAARPTDDLQDLLRQVSVSKELSDLVSLVKADQVDEKYRQITESVNKIAWGSDQEEKLKAARTKLLAVGDPAAKAKTIRGLAASLGAIRKTIEAADPLLGEAGEKALRTAKEHAKALATAAAQAEAGVDFTKEPAVHIGSQTWQLLYKAAVTFALEGFTAEPRFPSSDAKCPMCLQDLNAAAQDRVRRFKAFMSKESKVASDSAKAALDGFIKNITACAFPAADPHIAQQAAEQTSIPVDVIPNISIQLLARRERLLQNANAGEWTALPAFPSAAMVALRTAETELETKALETEKLADPVVRAALEKEVKAFEAVQVFSAQKSRVLKVIGQYSKAAILGRIASEINTRSISVEGKAVAERAVTAGLKAAFVQEMKNLGADGLVLADINPTASKGKTTFGIVLTGTVQNAKVGNVLSEGEQRVVALAYFLAEVQMAPDKVGIILDDPVSSLDHWWAERIAQRIAQLGVERQVIVFTHSIALVIEIEKHAAFTRTPVNSLYIEKGADGAGRCSPETAPWESMSVGKRLDSFKKQLPQLRAEHAKSPTGRQYARMAAQFCGDLRSTWERAVEEFVFCGVIERFGNSVSTGRLKGVVCTTETFKQVNEAMTKLSAITSAHDKARDAFAMCPNPEDLRVFIEKIEAFEKYQSAEKKTAEKERKPFESAPTVHGGVTVHGVVTVPVVGKVG